MPTNTMLASQHQHIYIKSFSEFFSVNVFRQIESIWIHSTDIYIGNNTKKKT